jgi:hypothetical protein
MAIKQTHIYRGHAIVHHVFASDQTSEKIEQFIVSRPGKNDNVAKTLSLDAAKAFIDEVFNTRDRYVINSA